MCYFSWDQAWKEWPPQAQKQNWEKKSQGLIPIYLFEEGPYRQDWYFNEEVLSENWKNDSILDYLEEPHQGEDGLAYYRILSYIPTQNTLGRSREGAAPGCVPMTFLGN